MKKAVSLIKFLTIKINLNLDWIINCTQSRKETSTRANVWASASYLISVFLSPNVSFRDEM